MAKFKQKKRESAIGDRVTTIIHPVRKDSDKQKTIRVLIHVKKHRRASGIWISLEDLPWLGTYAAEEVAAADGNAFQIPGTQHDAGCGGGSQRGRLEYIVAERRWEYKWFDSGADVLHHIVKDVPKWCFSKGRFKRANDDEVFTWLKEKTRIAIMAQVKERGLPTMLLKDDDASDGEMSSTSNN